MSKEHIANKEDLEKYLPLDGSVGMIAHLALGNNSGRVVSGKNNTETYTQMWACANKDKDGVLLQVNGSLSNKIKADSASLLEIIDGKPSGSKKALFGEHNLSLLQEKFNNGGLSVLDNAIRITTASLDSGESFTGTGKGKMFIKPLSNYCNITIDGTMIGRINGKISTIDIEFLTNFKVEIEENNAGAEIVAVFY